MAKKSNQKKSTTKVNAFHTPGTSRGFHKDAKGKVVQYREGFKKGVKIDPHTSTVHTNPHGGDSREWKAVRTVKGRDSKGETQHGKWRPVTSATTYEKGNLRSYMPKSAMKFADKMQTSKVVGTPSPTREVKKRKGRH